MKARKDKKQLETKKDRSFRVTPLKALILVSTIALGLLSYKLLKDQQISVYEEQIEKTARKNAKGIPRTLQQAAIKPIAPARLPLSGAIDAEARRLTETLMITTDAALMAAARVPTEQLVRQIAEDYKGKVINPYTVVNEDNIVQIFTSKDGLLTEVRSWPNLENPEFSAPDPLGNPPGRFRGGPLFVVRVPPDPPDDEQKGVSIYVGDPQTPQSQLPPPLLPTNAQLLGAGLIPGRYRLPKG